MSYIVKQDLIDELGEAKLLELSDDAGIADLDDPAVVARIDRAIAYAEGTFNSYARNRYTIPVLATVVVKGKCIDLAVFHFYKSRATSATKEGVYGVKKDAHDAALIWLKDLAMGKAAIDVPSSEETTVNPASPDEVLRGSSKTPVVFSDDKLKSY